MTAVLSATPTAIAVFVLLATPLAAQTVNPREPDPAAWIRAVYDLYKRAETDTNSAKLGADMGQLKKRASPALAALFRKDDACIKKNGGAPCGLDFDFVVNGQDNQLSDIKVAPADIKGDRASVVVTFKNFDSANRSEYLFVKQGSDWKLDDVVLKSKDVSGRLKSFLARGAV